MKSSQLSEALQKLKELNAEVLTSKSYDEFIYGQYNLWATWQQNIFQEIRNKINNNTSKNNKLKNITYRIFISVVSFFSILSLLIRRPKVIIYSTDNISPSQANDFRMNHIYDFLNANQISYFEFIHTHKNTSFIKNFFKRRRAVFYLESLNLFSRKTNNLLEKFRFKKKQFASNHKTLRAITRLSGAKILLTIDDVRHYHALVLACQDNKIKTIAFQHGHFTKYHVGWLANEFPSKDIIKTDVFALWSNYWQEELLRLGSSFTKEQLILATPETKKPKTVVKETNSKLRVLVPFETECPDDLAKQMMSLLLRQPNTEMVFKCRFDTPLNTQLRKYDISDAQVTVSYNLPEDIDVAVGTYSTLLYELIENLVPVAIIKSSFSFGERMVFNGLAEYVELNEETLLKELQKIANANQTTLQERQEKLVTPGVRNIDEFLGELVFETCHCEGEELERA